MISSFGFFLEQTFGKYKKTKSHRYQVNCPKCSALFNNYVPDDKFNLEINTEKSVFHCWKCEMGGGLSYLINRYGSKEDYNALKDLQLFSTPKELKYGYDGIKNDIKQEPISLPPEFISFKDVNLTDWKHAKPYDYLLKTRKLPEEYLYKYDLGFALKGRYFQRIIIPSFDKEDNINFFVARAFSDVHQFTYLNPYVNKQQIIFNEKHIDFNSIIFVVEGAFDFLSIPINTVTLLGKKMSNKLYRKIYKYKPNIILALDEDALKNSMKLFEELTFMGFDDKVRIVLFDKDEDIDSFRKNNGHDELLSKIKCSIDIDGYEQLKTKILFQ